MLLARREDIREKNACRGPAPHGRFFSVDHPRYPDTEARFAHWRVGADWVMARAKRAWFSWVNEEGQSTVWRLVTSAGQIAHELDALQFIPARWREYDGREYWEPAVWAHPNLGPVLPQVYATGHVIERLVTRMWLAFGEAAARAAISEDWTPKAFKARVCTPDFGAYKDALGQGVPRAIARHIARRVKREFDSAPVHSTHVEWHWKYSAEGEYFHFRADAESDW